MNIETVKIQGDGHLVNGSMSVPSATGNRHYQMVQDWIDAGNELEPEFTQAELHQQFASNEHTESTTQLKDLEVRWIKAMQGDLSEAETPESIAATMIQWRQYTTIENGKPKIREGKSRPL